MANSRAGRKTNECLGFMQRLTIQIDGFFMSIIASESRFYPHLRCQAKLTGWWRKGSLHQTSFLLSMFILSHQMVPRNPEKNTVVEGWQAFPLIFIPGGDFIGFFHQQYLGEQRDLSQTWESGGVSCEVSAKLKEFIASLTWWSSFTWWLLAPVLAVVKPENGEIN